MTTMSRLLPIPFILVFILHQIGQLLPETQLAPATKPLILLTIVLAFLVTVFVIKKEHQIEGMNTIVLLSCGAFLFSWLGDLALMVSGETWFIIGLLMFLVAQLFYIALFFKHVRTHKTFRPWSLLYALCYVGLMVVLVPHTGGLLIPVAVYGAILALMAFLASRTNGAILLGGLLFLTSDSILALNKFVPKDTLLIPYAGFWVMFTYSLAQALIAYGIIQHFRHHVQPKNQDNHLV